VHFRGSGRKALDLVKEFFGVVLAKIKPVSFRLCELFIQPRSLAPVVASPFDIETIHQR
jgi:hypothetical protein